MWLALFSDHASSIITGRLFLPDLLDIPAVISCQEQPCISTKPDLLHPHHTMIISRRIRMLTQHHQHTRTHTNTHTHTGIRKLNTHCLSQRCSWERLRLASTRRHACMIMARTIWTQRSY